MRENPVVLMHIAGCYPGADLAPADGPARRPALQWLSFIGSELHRLRPIQRAIVMAGLGPAIHDFLRQIKEVTDGLPSRP